MKSWLMYEWKYKRKRLIVETLTSICFMSGLIYISIMGNEANLYLFFSFETVGCIFALWHGRLRESINMIIMNSMALVIVIFGILNI